MDIGLMSQVPKRPPTNGDACEAGTGKRSGGRSSWWKRRSYIEKVLLALLLFTSLLAIILGILAAWSSAKYSNLEAELADDEMCLTPMCVKTASRILEAMDTAVDPCDDFFNYACGEWNRNHIIPDDMPSYNTFAKLREDLQAMLKVLLEEDVQEDDTAAIRHVKHHYASCLNLTAIEQVGDSLMKEFLRTLGGWPILDPSWDESKFDLIDILARLRLYNSRVLVRMWVSADDRNSSANVIQIDQPHLGMPSRDYFMKPRSEGPLVAYENFAVDVAKLLGADVNAAIKDVRDMVDFEIAIANITAPDEQRRDSESLYKKYTIAELYTNITDKFDWLRYLQIIFNNVSITIDDSHSVVIYASDYMRRLADLLQTTSNRTVANYIVWRATAGVINFMPKKYQEIKKLYNKVLSGTDVDQARWRLCVNYVNDNFGMAVGRMFVQKHFDESAKASAEGIIDYIRESFEELLDEAAWMDNETRVLARDKAEGVNEKIGYPEYILDDEALNKEFDGIVSSPTTYFENALNNFNVQAKYNLKMYTDPVDKERWVSTPAVINAFYSTSKNQIVFPAGILQPPFYHEEYPMSLNFGGIAMVVGHELTHGFDDKGRQFDRYGNLKNSWTQHATQGFRKGAQCIIEQYSNYTIPEIGLNINGQRTQGENIADNGGLKQAFRAYRNWIRRRGREEARLPGVNLTHNQLFFINFAQIWCGTSRPEHNIQAILSARHAPGKFRVIGSISNSYDFATAFSCPAGSKMNPDHKCAVW